MSQLSDFFHGSSQPSVSATQVPPRTGKRIFSQQKNLQTAGIAGPISRSDYASSVPFPESLHEQPYQSTAGYTEQPALDVGFQPDPPFQQSIPNDSAAQRHYTQPLAQLSAEDEQYLKEIEQLRAELEMKSQILNDLKSQSSLKQAEHQPRQADLPPGFPPNELPAMPREFQRRQTLDEKDFYDRQITNQMRRDVAHELNRQLSFKDQEKESLRKERENALAIRLEDLKRQRQEEDAVRAEKARRVQEYKAVLDIQKELKDKIRIEEKASQYGDRASSYGGSSYAVSHARSRGGQFNPITGQAYESDPLAYSNQGAGQRFTRGNPKYTPSYPITGDQAENLQVEMPRTGKKMANYGSLMMNPDYRH